MVSIEKREIPACCGKKQVIWKLNVPLKKEHLIIFQQAGFQFLQTYLDAGMLYVEDQNFFTTGVFGLNELKIKCKTKQCADSLVLFEQTIINNL